MSEQATIPQRRPAAPDRTLLYIAAGVLGVVLLVTLAVLLIGKRDPTTFPAGSPEAAVQQYATAYERDDYAAAYALFSHRVQSSMTLSAYRTMVMQGKPMYGPGSSRRVVFDRTTGAGDQRVVHVTVEIFSGGNGNPFGGGGSSYSYSATVPMLREGGAWHIDAALNGFEPGPYPLMEG